MCDIRDIFPGLSRRRGNPVLPIMLYSSSNDTRG